jgi:hypothetical protein
MTDQHKHLPLTYPTEGLVPIKAGDDLAAGTVLVCIYSKSDMLKTGDVCVLSESVYVDKGREGEGRDDTVAEVYRLRVKGYNGYFMWRFARMPTTTRDEAL